MLAIMSGRPQFSLSALLVIIAVLSVPLAMMVSGKPSVLILGYFALLTGGGGSLGYLLGGEAGVLPGMALGFFLSLVLATMCGLPFGLLVPPD